MGHNRRGAHELPVFDRKLDVEKGVEHIAHAGQVIIRTGAIIGAAGANKCDTRGNGKIRKTPAIRYRGPG